MEEQSLENIIKYRTIQVEDTPKAEYIDYHKYNQAKDQEDSNGEFLVDYIIERASFPNGRWTLPAETKILV